MQECFACFSDMCPACDGGGCTCSHTSYQEPKPSCGGASCTVVQRLYENRSTVQTLHGAGCPKADPEKLERQESRAKMAAAAKAPGQLGLMAFVVLGVALLAGCTDNRSFADLLEDTPECPASGGTWIWSDLREKEVPRAQAALASRGYTQVSTYGQANPLDPPGGPYHRWTVIGECAAVA